MLDSLRGLGYCGVKHGGNGGWLNALCTALNAYMLTFNFSDVILLKMPKLIEELSRRAFHNRLMSARPEIECDS